MKSLTRAREFFGHRSVPPDIHGEIGAADDSLGLLLRTTTAKKLAGIGVPGAQVAIRRQGELLWSACAGQLRLDTPERTSDTDDVRRRDRFVIASVTKLVVACTALSLAERGELDLGSPVAQWLPDLPHGNRITLRQLLGHRSGLPEYFRDKRIRRKLKTEPLATWNRPELLDAVGQLGSERDPDQEFAYRNTNYIAIGEIVERCTGKSIGDLIEDRVTRPLGLTTMSFDDDDMEHGGGRLASPHRRRFNRVIDPLTRTNGRIPSHAIGQVWTDGGIAASAEDLATLTEALFEGVLLNQATVDDMVNRSAAPGSAVGGILGSLQRIYLGPVQRSYGLGVAIEQREDTRTVGHEGMYYGWSAATTFDPHTRVTVSVLTNLAKIPVPAERLERSLRLVMTGMAP